MEFVEHHAADVLERRVGLQHARQDSLGHDFDPGGAADPRLQPCANADGPAHRFTDEMSHTLRHRTRRDAARLEHEQGAPRKPAASEERKGYDGALACARRGLQNNVAACRKRFLERRERLADRQRREIGENHGAKIPVGNGRSGRCPARRDKMSGVGPVAQLVRAGDSSTMVPSHREV